MALLGVYDIIGAYEGVVDITAPVISISPPQTSYTVVQGGVFTPPVAISTDDNDGVKTLTPSGTVNVNAVGTYTLTYTDTDLAGNSAIPVIVTVNVIEEVDSTAPVIMVSGSETTTIERGEKIPVFTAATDDGSEVIVGGDTVDNLTVGNYVITFNAVDDAGNIAAQVTRTVVVSAGVMETLYQNTVGTTDRADEMWQHSDNFWFVPVNNPETFINAEYIISDTTGNPMLTADLSDNVVVTTGGFLIKVSDLLITFSGIGNHQFVLTDSLGNKRPPEFFRKVFINKVALRK